LRTSTSPGASLGLDPLSQYINRRTSVLSPPTFNRTHSDTSKLSQIASRDTTASARSSLQPQTTPNEEPVAVIKKGVKFLGRIIGKSNKKDFADIVDDATSLADERPEGAEAEVFCSAVDNISYNPRHPQPPAYIKVRSTGKKEKEFNRMFLAQELHDETLPATPTLSRSITTFSSSPRKLRKKRAVDDEAIWATSFSNDGRYLASGGQDKVVKVWAVLSSPDDRQQHERDEDNGTEGVNTRLNAPVFRQRTVQVFEGHTGPILDLCWSKNNFLISTSMDKTVKLWHISRSECLCTFKHSDVVTSVRFHPKDDRFFLAGSLDSKLRLWSIPDKSVAYWVSVAEMITAVAFTPDGKQAIAGCLSGHCFFYDTEGLKYSTSIHVRSTHGKNAKGSKITGIQTITVPPENSNGDVKMLVTSNDSRIRLYNLRDKSLEQKFRGAINTSSQIQARFSNDAKYIVCGSEDGKVFIWSVDWLERDSRLLEFFEANNTATTVTAFAPMPARQRLAGSGDPVFDLCNPPHVTLLSRTEEEASESAASWRVGDDAPRRRSPSMSSAAGDSPMVTRKPDIPSAAYTTRSMHRGGNIIVTGSSDGVVKVFRQDCAWRQRQRALETASIFSKRLGRRSSLATHSSFRSNRKDSTGTQNPSDRVLSWRQNIGLGRSSSKSSFDKTRPSSLINGRSSSIRSDSPSLEHFKQPLPVGPDGLKSLPKSTTWPLQPVVQEKVPSPPSLPAYRQNGTGRNNGNENAPPVRQPSRRTQPIPINDDDSDDETFNSADEEPQPRSSPAGHNPYTSSSRTQDLKRTDTATYWSRDAWRDQMANQVNTIHQLRQERRDARESDSDNGSSGSVRRYSAAGSLLTDEEVSSASQTASRAGTRGAR